MCQTMINFDALEAAPMKATERFARDTRKPTYEVNLHQFDAVLVSTSGGKDSQTALRAIVLMAEAQGYDKARIVAVHSHLDGSEWEEVQDTIQDQCNAYGIDLVVTQARTKKGNHIRLLDRVLERGMWPSAKYRSCTSDFKRGPINRVVTAVDREIAANDDKPRRRILNVMGIRGQESPKRASKPWISYNQRASSKTRKVYDYLPIHAWTEEQVWTDIADSGVRYHTAYDLGMPRLSCVFCIMAPRKALLLAGEHNPKMLAEYADVERKTGHLFTEKISLVQLQADLAAGERADSGQASEDWGDTF